MMGQAFGMGAGMWLLWIALIALLAWAIWGFGVKRPPPPDDRPHALIETLKWRLARGEIDSEEYRRLREELEK